MVFGKKKSQGAMPASDEDFKKWEENVESAEKSVQQARTDWFDPKRHDEFKSRWNKNGVIQFKNERMAILQRKWGEQVQFLMAFDDLTNEGYRLMAIDEGKEASGKNIAGGVNSYYYFQNMKYVSSKQI